MGISFLLVAGCATKSADIAPNFVSPVLYQNYTCQQLAVEAQSISQQAAIASGQQDKIHNDDVAKTTVGIVLFWPVLLFNKGDGAAAANLANIKGQMQAVEQASIQKQCGFKFQN